MLYEVSPGDGAAGISTSIYPRVRVQLSTGLPTKPLRLPAFNIARLFRSLPILKPDAQLLIPNQHHVGSKIHSPAPGGRPHGSIHSDSKCTHPRREPDTPETRLCNSGPIYHRCPSRLDRRQRLPRAAIHARPAGQPPLRHYQRCHHLRIHPSGGNGLHAADRVPAPDERQPNRLRHGHAGGRVEHPAVERHPSPNVQSSAGEEPIHRDDRLPEPEEHRGLQDDPRQQQLLPADELFLRAEPLAARDWEREFLQLPRGEAGTPAHWVFDDL